jgi:ribosomal-protein-alanine N-acetyltransferase
VGDRECGEEIRLRSYRSTDLPAIFVLDEICFEPAFRFSLGLMRRFAEARNALTIIAERGAGIAGFCIAHVERSRDGERVGYIVTLDVAPEQRRRGLAGLIMREIETQAHDAGCVVMALHVAVANDSAIRFYERSGYVPSHVVRGFYGPGLDALVYRKPLCAEPASGGEWNSFAGDAD